GDDAGARALRLPSSAHVIRYGIDDADARLRARDLRAWDGCTRFAVAYDDQVVAEAALQVPGRHNVRNALAAIASGILLGADPVRLCEGLAGFTGVERRFQRLGEAGGVSVVDDYAHHPSEIAATLQAARELFPGRRLLAAFQPHLYTRTRDFHAEFGQALAAADLVLLTEIYAAREQPIPGVTAALVREAAERAGGAVAWVGARDALAGALADAVRPGDVVLTLGAGDITRTGPELLGRLAGA
ncbi:MAG TPA: cyanophycin synthetase, partial [Gemmatimonadaceae bacterium]|nr:cyanophycin synthetase [Gemmatimonadaceae bacterium]